MSIANGRFRKKENKFTQVSNDILDDKELSWKAKGIYAVIQRYITIPDWELYVNHIISLSKDGAKSFNSGWKELKDKGYLKQYRIPNRENRGAFLYEYELLDVPDTSTPALINCDADGNPKIKNNDHTPQKGYYAQRIICSKDNMLKGGDIYNTNSTNTNFNNTNCTTQLPMSSENNILDLENKNLIETYTHLKLSNNMIKQVSKWDYVRLGLALKIFIQKEGKYFAMLKKIYEDDGNFVQKNTTSTFEDGINPKSFNNFPAREYDYDDLEKKLLGWDK